VNSEWLEKNKRALIGLAIFAILLMLNFITYSRRAKPAVAPVAVTAAPGARAAGTAPAKAQQRPASGSRDPRPRFTDGIMKKAA